MLDTVTNRLRLQKLGGVYQSAEVIRVQEGLLHVVHYLAVRGGIALMLLHNIREDIAVLRECKRLDGLKRRERLEAELREEAEIELAVLGKGLAAVPYIPVVHVSPVGTVGLVKTAAARRRCRPVERIRRLLAHYRREDLLVHLKVVLADLRVGVRTPLTLLHEHLHLVVAAKQTEARVMPYASHVVPDLSFDILLEVRREPVVSTCEHHVLPHDKARLVARLIKIV